MIFIARGIALLIMAVGAIILYKGSDWSITIAFMFAVFALIMFARAKEKRNGRNE